MTLEQEDLNRLRNLLGKQELRETLAPDEKDEVRDIVAHEVPRVENASWEMVEDYAYTIVGANVLAERLKEGEPRLKRR